MPLWDHDQTECGSQEIVGEKNATSDVSNGLLHRSNQTDFFTDYTLTVQAGGSFVLEVRHQQVIRGPDCRQDVVRNVLTVFISPITL